MKKISEHLGAIVVALAAVALLITAITFFKAPLSTFFNSIITTETGVGDKILNGLDDVDAPSLSGGGSGGGGGSSVTMLDGDGQTINKQLSTTALSFRSSADLADFQSVKVNGTEVASSNYTLASGSTIVNFKDSYLATLPAGNHSIEIISNSGTAEGAFNVIDTAVVPAGATYYSNACICASCGWVFTDSTFCDGCGDDFGELYGVTLPAAKYTEGQEFPASINVEVKNSDYYIGDVFETEDYYYVVTNDGWRVKAKGDGAYGRSYGEIYAVINGKYVTSMEGAFSNCEYLETAPAIPSSVTNMKYAFSYCHVMTTAPAIPSSVTNMDYTFADCHNLISAPAIPSSVTSMAHTFENCSALTTAPAIPNSVTSMECTFAGCESLSGDVEVNANPSVYDSCFNLVGGEINIIGSCSQETKEALANTVSTIF